ncbi:MAG: hypothetical protein OCC49_12665 [Fibrobacterales bacterium]
MVHCFYKNIKIGVFICTLFTLWGIIGCSSEGEYEFKSKIGQKVTLEQFPDSLDLDSAKNIRHYKQDTTHRKKKLEMDLETALVKKPQMGSLKNRTSGQKITTKKFITKELFVERFSKQITKMKNDPQNKGLFISITPRTTMSIKQLLSKQYNIYSEAIPDVLIKYELKTLNPTINFNAIPKGTPVVIPRVDLFK